MTDDKEIVYQPIRHSTRKLRCTRRRRLDTSILLERCIDLCVGTAIITFLLSCFLAVIAMGCWGMEIIHINANPNIFISLWYYQKKIYLGSALVAFSIFLGAALMGAVLSTGRDKY